MSDPDPLDAVIVAALDHLEGAAPRPSLHHLTGADRLRAEELLAGLAAGRGMDPHASRPSVESLLADTPLAPFFPAENPRNAATVDLSTIRTTLTNVDSRVRVDIDPASATVIYSYLDLRARFLLVPTATPTVTDEIRAAVQTLLDSDPDTDRVGVVAGHSDELLTQVLSADDLAATITTPRGEPHVRWEPHLPLTLAARRILEQSAPEWPAFDFDQARGDALDITGLAERIARTVIEREAARAYRGDKRRAYRALVGHEGAFADLVTRAATRGADLELDEETTRILQAAA